MIRETPAPNPAPSDPSPSRKPGTLQDTPTDRHQRERLVTTLRERRVALGLTQVEVARRMGVSPRGVSQLELSRNQHVYASTLQRYARAVGYHLRFELDRIDELNGGGTQ